MADVGLHGVISMTISRWCKMPAWVMFFAFLGGAAPDIWSHLPNIHTVFDHEPVTYEWYHFAHSWIGAGAVALACAIVMSWMATRRYNALNMGVMWSALFFAVGFALHVGVDQFWHKPGGGWWPWGFWANVGGWVLMLWLNLPWAIRTLKNLFSKKEGTSNG